MGPAPRRDLTLTTHAQLDFVDFAGSIFGVPISFGADFCFAIFLWVLCLWTFWLGPGPKRALTLKTSDGFLRPLGGLRDPKETELDPALGGLRDPSTCLVQHSDFLPTE